MQENHHVCSLSSVTSSLITLLEKQAAFIETSMIRMELKLVISIIERYDDLEIFQEELGL